ncbi:hypothetical protein PSHT_10642 [Puccinia striiformis]|uniref:Uncharacterized protein n=1 Tax=Puccinia striiformis TaxID=27350 RepID=A0A2S4V8I0_9BASI|nr:hypothetical protein PSHT_10642 [Puccinia striiformis]
MTTTANHSGLPAPTTKKYSNSRVVSPALSQAAVVETTQSNPLTSSPTLVVDLRNQALDQMREAFEKGQINPAQDPSPALVNQTHEITEDLIQKTEKSLHEGSHTQSHQALHPFVQAASPTTKEGLLVRAFQLQILPLIAPYVEWRILQKEQDDDKAACEMQADPDPIDLSGINPNNSSITVDMILTIIAARRPNVKLPETMNKPAAISFFYQYVSPRPLHGHPPPFTTWPKAVPKPYHRYLTRDELCFVIQCHVPVLFIPSAITKECILAIYEQFVLDDISEEEIFEGLHFFVCQEPERSP